MRFLSIILSLSISFASCKKGNGDNAEQPPARTYMDLAYGTDAEQKMDLYLPTGRSSNETPIMVLIHGGAWYEGDKSDFDVYVTELKERLPHFAIANINYRLADENSNHFPTQETDVQAALSFLLQNSTTYGYSNQVALIGASAGGHLALLHAYKYDDPVEAVISFFGPTDLKKMYEQPLNPLIPLLLAELIGGTPADNPSAYEASSPVFFQNTLSPPTMLLHGTADPLVPVSQSTALRDSLVNSGVPVEYVEYAGAGHGWAGSTLDHSFDRIAEFLSQHME